LIYAILVVHIQIPNSISLKDKRQVIKSIIEKIKNIFNVSVAEIEKNEVWNESVLACAHISNNKIFSETYLKKVFAYIEKSALEFIILDYSVFFNN
jgi:uncharacterized protein YlxP (DUF503 family)